jgi:hypothetical protein
MSTKCPLCPGCCPRPRTLADRLRLLERRTRLAELLATLAELDAMLRVYDEKTARLMMELRSLERERAELLSMSVVAG